MEKVCHSKANEKKYGMPALMSYKLYIKAKNINKDKGGYVVIIKGYIDPTEYQF